VAKAVRFAAAARPVGLALSADGRALLVAEADASQPGGAVWRKHPLAAAAGGSFAGAGAARAAATATTRVHGTRGADAGGDGGVFARVPGGAAACHHPGGLAVDTAGNVWAACGASGVLVFDSAGAARGVVDTGGRYAATGVAFGDDGFLYITAAEGSVLRVPVKVKPTLVAT
jgi:sugar lactone lactonase YvrE